MDDTGSDVFPYHDMHPDDFPFVVKFISRDTDELVHEITISGPGVVSVPGFGAGKVRVEVHWPDGTVEREG